MNFGGISAYEQNIKNVDGADGSAISSKPVSAVKAANAAALGDARGAAGVLQADGVVHGDFNIGLGVRVRADEGVEVIQAVYLRQFYSPGGKLEGDDALHRALGVLQHGDRLGGEGSHDHNGFGAAVIELSGQLGYGVEGVGRNFDSADLPYGVHRQQVLRHVGRHDRHAVALFDAQVEERIRQPARHIVAVGVGEYKIAQNGVRLLRVGLRPVVEPPFAGLVLILDLFRNLRIVLFARQLRILFGDFVQYFQVFLVLHVFTSFYDSGIFDCYLICPSRQFRYSLTLRCRRRKAPSASPARM